MVRRQPLNDDERRLLRITARMPLASVANLAPVLGLDEEKVRTTFARTIWRHWLTCSCRRLSFAGGWDWLSWAMWPWTAPG